MTQTISDHRGTVSESTVAPEIQHARRFIEANRTELSRADTKAGRVLTAACALPFAPVLPVTGRLWPQPGRHPASAWLLVAGWLLWALAFVTLLLALLPNLGRDTASGRQPPPTWFGDLHRYRGRELHRALSDAAARPLDAALSELAWSSGAVLRKYVRIRAGMVLLAAAAVLMFLGSL